METCEPVERNAIDILVALSREHIASNCDFHTPSERDRHYQRPGRHQHQPRAAQNSAAVIWSKKTAIAEMGFNQRSSELTHDFAALNRGEGLINASIDIF